MRAGSMYILCLNLSWQSTTLPSKQQCLQAYINTQHICSTTSIKIILKGTVMCCVKYFMKFVWSEAKTFMAKRLKRKKLKT